MTGTDYLRALATAALCVGALVPAIANADEQLVYWPLVTDGTEYRRVPYPREAGPLLMLADTEIVIEARPAWVSYWPITAEYLADFSKDPLPVEGDLEIVDAAGSVTRVEATPYLLWHPDGVAAGPAELIHGERTAAFYDDYVKTAREAAAKEKEYQRIVAEHQAALEAWLRIAAERPPNLPKPPPELDIPEPEPYRAFATEPKRAAVVALPPGNYTVRIRGTDGMILPRSERELVSFAPSGRAVGYVLRPEDRWTRPIVSFAPEETIYTTGQTDLLLQPVPVVAYDARYFARLFRPQSFEVAEAASTIWTPEPGAKPFTDDSLALWNRDEVVETVPLTPYRVAQLPGASRGYVIEPFEATSGSPLQPDFYAMRIGREADVTRIGLQSGTAQVGASERQIRRVTVPSEPLLFLPALLPLAVGLVLRLWRSRTGARIGRASAV